MPSRISPERDFCGTPMSTTWSCSTFADTLPGIQLEFCEQLKDRSPQQRIVFLVGAPTYLSLTWPGEVARPSPAPTVEETVKRFLDAA